MKKALKVLLIIILIGASVGVTCFFFFKNLKARQNSLEAVSNFVYSSEKVEFDEGIKIVRNNSSTRFNEIIITNNKLTEIAIILNGYLIDASNSKIDENKIVNKCNSLNSSLNSAQQKFKEYQIKCKNNTFNKNLGANDMYVAYSNYLIKYANMLEVINSEITKNSPELNMDAKFAVIEIYLNVVKTSFNEFNEVESIKYAKNLNNITYANTTIIFADGNLINFNINNNKFLENYKNCNKTDFANTLYETSNSVNSITPNATQKQKAMYYFKLIFG